TTDRGGHYGLPDGHRLEDRHRQTLDVGRVDDHVGSGDEVQSVGSAPEEANLAVDSSLGRLVPKTLEIAGKLLAPDGDDDDVLVRGEQQLCGCQEVGVSLVGPDVPDVNDELRRVVDGQLLSSCRGAVTIRLDGHTVFDDSVRAATEVRDAVENCVGNGDSHRVHFVGDPVGDPCRRLVGTGDVVLGVDDRYRREQTGEDPRARQVGVDQIGPEPLQELAPPKGHQGIEPLSTANTGDFDSPPLDLGDQSVLPGEDVGDVVFEPIGVPVGGSGGDESLGAADAETL